MKRIIIIYFLSFIAIGCKAIIKTITFEDGLFKYETKEGSTTATITKYLGSETSVVFPTSVTYESTKYEINTIKGSSSIIDNSNVEEIFIPSGITTIEYVTNKLTSLKTVVIEDGNKLEKVYRAFVVGSNYTSFNLDNIIVLGSCDFNSADFISNSNDIMLFKAGIINIYYQGTSKAESVQMYLFDTGNYSARPFGFARFNYLISALQKCGKDISTIKEIDLSSMNSISGSHKVNFTFNNDGYDPSSELSYDAKVITSTESYTRTEKRTTTITDKDNFTAPQYNIATDITYNRTNTHDWNSVCLPFDIKETDFATDCKIYTISAATDDQISLTRVETPETIVEAGTPCFIYSTANEWNLNLTNVTISYNVAPKTIKVDENWEVIGSFTNETIGTGKYKLNSQGSEFGITNNDQATVTAFRCYISPTSTITDAPAQLKVRLDEEASITLVPNDAEPQKVKLYDLMGRPRKEGSQGIFIKSTR